MKRSYPDDWFEQIKAEYPKRAKGKGYGFPKAFTEIQSRFKEGHSFETILQGTKDYCAACRLSGDYGTEFVKMASTFYGKQLCFLDEYELEDVVEIRYRGPPPELSEMERKIEAKKGEQNLERLMALKVVK